MEPAKIDWKRVESIFEEDKLYENIHAPKWFDFLATGDPPRDDEAWFCRPDCNHPKTAEDFLLRLTPTSKVSSAANTSRSPLGDRNQRDAKLKRRGQSQASFTSCNAAKFIEDGENQNPNLSTPLNHQARTMKAMIKSSSEKGKPVDDASCTNEVPRLKSTLSARNLFAGKDILSHITEFCTELKKIATRVREREDEEKPNEKESGETEENRNVMVVANDGFGKVLVELVDVKDKERRPLLEVCGEKSEGAGKEDTKEKQSRLKRTDDAENIPVSLNLSNIKQKGEDRLLQIRTNPPSPQCFSATREPIRTIPSKASKSRFTEKGILQELKHEVTMKQEVVQEKGRTLSIVDGREPRAVDVFWFLKPCTLSG